MYGSAKHNLGRAAPYPTGQPVRSVIRSNLSQAFGLLATVAALGCSIRQPDGAGMPSKYLFVWAGPHRADGMADSAHHTTGANDFLAVIDADPASNTYGKVLASRDVGTSGAMAHHTELSLPVGHPLFANDYMTGQTFLLDVTDPLAPRLAARIDSVPGYRRAHSFARLGTGHVLAAMQFGNASLAGDPGGLAEFDAGGRLLRSSSAADTAFPGARIRPNGIELLPGIDRVVTTSMPMDDEETADVVQIWRLSDLRLLHTLAVPVLPGHSGNAYPYDSRALVDGRTAMLNTYYCGFYRLSALDTEHPQIELVHALREPGSEGCAVAVVVSHYWVVPVASRRAVVNLDVADPSHPVEVSRLPTDSTFRPHWISADPGSDRIVICGTDDSEARVLIAHLDRTSGRLSWDERFRDAGSTRPGINFARQDWPHGNIDHVMAHAALFGPVKQ
jgi:hypothetical protein